MQISVLMMMLAIGQDNLLEPPEPTFTTTTLTVTEDVDIKIPEVLVMSEYTRCNIMGVSLTDVTKGRIILRTYPGGCMKVTDGISFIDRTPYLMIKPEKEGEYDLIFIMHKADKSLVFIEKHFSVVSP
jgi:hypothetical protein